MCGIAGYYARENKAIPNLDAMLRAIEHRGPDMSGKVEDRNVGIGHQRLTIIDLSRDAAQPMSSASGNSLISYNGEIYNFSSLAEGKNLKTSCDTEALLEHLEEKGLQGLGDLNGMYAFALFDRKNRVLHLVRDRMGIKPLYYYWDGQLLLFASEIKAILKGLKHTPEINRSALADYLHLKYIPSPATIFKNIYKLQAGHYLRYDGHEPVIERYYNLNQQLQKRESESATEDVDELLRGAVESRLMADVPLGAFLSGGTDSSLVCSYLPKESSQTFTIGFEETTHDESIFAQQVASQLGLNNHQKLFNESALVECLETFIHQFDEPFADDSALPMLLLSKYARENVTVALSGDGGDELFMGYGYYRWMRRIKRLKSIIGRPGLHAMASVLALDGNRAKRAARVLNIPKGEWWTHVWSQEQYMFDKVEIDRLLNIDYSCSLNDSWRNFRSMGISDNERISLFDLNHYLPEDLLHKVDYASMAHGLEVRTPILDHRVVEFILTLPPDERLSKKLPKRLLERSLPQELVHRQKWGFPAPMARLLKGPLSAMVDDKLSRSSLEAHGLFNVEEVRQLVNRFKGGEEFHFSRLWSLLVFQLWFNRYIE